jgi:hypothetical protein
MGIGTDGLSQAAAAGAAAATTTLLLYPLDVVKTRLNTGTDEKGVKYDGVLDVLQRQWRRRGLRGFYSGIQVRASRRRKPASPCAPAPLAAERDVGLPAAGR